MVFLAIQAQSLTELYNATDQDGKSNGIGGLGGNLGIGLNFADRFSIWGPIFLLVDSRVGSDSFDGNNPGVNVPAEIGLKLGFFIPSILAWSTIHDGYNVSLKTGYRFNSDPQLRDHAYLGAEVGAALFSSENIFVGPIIGGKLGITAQKNGQFFDGSCVYAGLNFILAP